MAGSQNERSLATVADSRGTLTVAEGEAIPFPVERIYWIDSMPIGVWRGAHAHKELRQVAFALRGKFEFVLKDGLGNSQIHEVTQSSGPLQIDAGIWRDFCALEPNGLLLVAASRRYDSTDYIREWAKFETWARNTFTSA